MFNNIGGKIKALAKVLCWIGIGISVIMAIAVWANGSGSVSYNSYGSNVAVGGFFGGLLILVFGCLFSWIGSFFAYGFGQLIEDTEEIRKNIKHE